MGELIGAVCGLRSEAHAVRAAPWRVEVAGAHAGRARALAEGLYATGAGIVLSVGVAGGLDPRLAPGDLVAPAAVRLPDGGVLAADAAWTDRLSGAGAQIAPLAAGSDDVVGDVAAKRALAATGAAVVDMETHGVALAAQAAGRPWAALRAVADPWDYALPGWTAALVTPTGRIDVAMALAGLWRRPGDLTTLLIMGRANQRALAALRAAASRLK